MSLSVVYLAHGALRVIDGASAQPRTIESRFAADVHAKALKEQQRHAWKNAESGSSMISSSVLWGKGQHEEPVKISLTSLCRGKDPSQFLYTLRTDHVCAILQVQGMGAEEQRLWNNNIKRINYPSVHPIHGHVVCAVEHKIGTANIAIRLSDDTGLAEVTEGDSMDTAPAWVPREQLQVVFQSAGIGRNKDGLIGGVGPYAIQLLEVETGELTTLAEDQKFDFLNPRMTPDGTLFFIRRPYTGNASAGLLDLLQDIVFFPFRLGRAFFGFLNIFSMMYSGKQLKTVKQHGAQQMDLPQMIVFGNLVKASQAGDANDGASLVPKSWQLIRRNPSGQEQILANSVLTFDLSQDGTVVYSNGKSICSLDAQGKATELARDVLIQQVVCLS